MIAVILVLLTFSLFGAVGVYAFLRQRVHAPAEQVEPLTRLLASKTTSTPVEHRLVEEAKRISAITGQPISTILLRLQKALNDPVAAEGVRMSSPAATAPSRGVDRVPARLRVERTKPLPDPILPVVREFRGRWVSTPYRNPDRLARLAKNGRLRAELRRD